MDNRYRKLLKTLIEKYIAEGQPIGSKSLAESSKLDISAATVRNVMAELEDMGMVVSPHISAGRIPTVRGFRFFVDTLLTIKSIKNHEVNAGKPLKFIEASLFQWVNPKAWTIAITVSTAFYPSEENYIFAFLFLAFFASLVNLPCISLWALFGASLRKFIDNERIKKIIEYFFALLLVLTGIYLVIN